MQDKIKKLIQESISVKEKLVKDCLKDIETIINLCIQAVKSGGKIIFCGNGGSAADSQHLAAELEDVDQLEAEIRAELDRKPPFSRSDLAIDGADIMKMFDLRPGPVVGNILDHLMEAVLDNPDDNTRARLEEIARHFYDNNIKNVSDKGSKQ